MHIHWNALQRTDVRTIVRRMRIFRGPGNFDVLEIPELTQERPRGNNAEPDPNAPHESYDDRDDLVPQIAVSI